MVSLLKKHPIASIAVGLGVAWLLFGSKTASAQPSPAPAPGPSPAPPGPVTTTQVVGLAPGLMSPVSLPSQSTIVLQLPQGATWLSQGGFPPVYQAPGSVLGGTVTPIVPIVGSNAPQTWTNLTGQGTLSITWTDANGAAQSTTLSVITTGGTPNVGGA